MSDEAMSGVSGSKDVEFAYILRRMEWITCVNLSVLESDYRNRKSMNVKSVLFCQIEARSAGCIVQGSARPLKSGKRGSGTHPAPSPFAPGKRITVNVVR
jgi:hypothetical protein